MRAVFCMAPTKHMGQSGKQYGTHFETVQAPEAFQFVTFKKAIVPPMCGHPFQLFLSGLCPLNTRPVCASCVGVCAREQRLQHKTYPMACKKTESGSGNKNAHRPSRAIYCSPWTPLFNVGDAACREWFCAGRKKAHFRSTRHRF